MWWPSALLLAVFVAGAEVAANQFIAFLERQTWRGNLRDFAFAASQNPGFPDPRSWEELKAYLLRTGSQRRTIDAAEYIWRLYVADGIERMFDSSG